MNLSLPEYFCVLFLNLARGHETIKLRAVQTEVLCMVFTLGLEPKLIKLNFSIVFFDLVWGQPPSVFPASWYFSQHLSDSPDESLKIEGSTQEPSIC